MGTPTVPDDLRTLRLTQGHAWIDRLADIEGWPDHQRQQHHDALRTTPLHVLEDVVERWRALMWRAMEKAGQVPTFERKRPWGAAAPPPPRQPKPRGLAKHLQPKHQPQPGQAELFRTTDKDA
ncbi:hypothetical protein [Cupriavidus oxalaticus]|uniref:Uncharacterized protein n=1 Tax=Cupriavidus oxalaticus TaxID=96344 RepID=A0A5P3VFM7_9BURK|nr:hypothetical protein [Cupriavidus oxalaticus]QEZ44718.1 hypothetical protein D2917_11050 [Cupriavidus oxalaticus]